MDESRKKFEDWCESFHGNPPIGGWESSRCRDFYYTHHIDVLWCAWKASRAAIEIELPPTVDGSNVPFAGNAWNAYRVEAVEAICAAGIKVKE